MEDIIRFLMVYNGLPYTEAKKAYDDYVELLTVVSNTIDTQQRRRVRKKPLPNLPVPVMSFDDST